MADAVPVGRQPGGILIMMRAIQDINSLTWQGAGWRVREWRLNGEIVAHEETATARSSSTAVCPTETLSVAGLHLCSPAQIIEIIERNKNGSVQRSETDQGVASLVLPADLEENVLVRDETFLPSHVASPPV